MTDNISGLVCHANLDRSTILNQAMLENFDGKN